MSTPPYSSSGSPGAAWHADPTGQHEQRYWDGQRWTDHVSNQGVQATAPLPIAPVAAAQPVYAPTPVYVAPLSPNMPKSKTTAVLLAVFLTFWTWVYTYKTDAWKFWMNLALSVLTLGFWGVLVSWPWAIIDAARRSDDWYRKFPNGDALQNQPQVHAVAPGYGAQPVFAAPTVTAALPAPPALPPAAKFEQESKSADTAVLPPQPGPSGLS